MQFSVHVLYFNEKFILKRLQALRNSKPPFLSCNSYIMSIAVFIRALWPAEISAWFISLASIFVLLHEYIKKEWLQQSYYFPLMFLVTMAGLGFWTVPPYCPQSPSWDVSESCIAHTVFSLPSKRGQSPRFVEWREKHIFC